MKGNLKGKRYRWNPSRYCHILDEMELDEDQTRFYKMKCCCAKKIRSCRKFQGRKCKKDGECGKKGRCECHCPPGVIAHLVLYETTPGGEWYCGQYPLIPTYCKCCCRKKNSDFCRDCKNNCLHLPWCRCCNCQLMISWNKSIFDQNFWLQFINI